MSGEEEKTPTPPWEGEEEEDDFDDLVNQINYNTINSLAALKEILARTNTKDVAWFQHYFLHHVNRLPSRSQYPGRRLSECPEEDESAGTEDVPKLQESSSSSSSAASSEDEDEESASKTSPTSSAPPTPKRNPSLTPDTPPSPRTLSRGTSPHFDKRYVRRRARKNLSCRN